MDGGGLGCEMAEGDRRTLSLRLSLSLSSNLMANEISSTNEVVLSRTASSSWMFSASPCENTPWNAASSHPVSAAKIRKFMAKSATELAPCLRDSSRLETSFPRTGWSKILRSLALNKVKEEKNGRLRSRGRYRPLGCPTPQVNP